MRIYLPKKVIFSDALVNVIFSVDMKIYLHEKVIRCHGEYSFLVR